MAYNLSLIHSYRIDDVPDTVELKNGAVVGSINGYGDVDSFTITPDVYKRQIDVSINKLDKLITIGETKVSRGEAAKYICQLFFDQRKEVNVRCV